MELQLLYKYSSINKFSEKTISNPQVWFSAPKHLNDPFECRPWIEFKFTSEQLVNGMASELRRSNPNITPHVATAHAVGLVLEGRQHNPATWEAVRRDMISEVTQRVGLYCLSENNDSVLMWAHYGAEHTGYCLGFESTDSTPFFGTALQVQYSENLPTIDTFNAPNEHQVQQLFLTKYSGWSYEQEWRIIDHTTGSGLKEYPAPLLKSITFGLRTSSDDRQKIRYWAERRGHPITFLECVRDERQFKIHTVEVR